MRIAVITNAYPPKARGGAGRIAALQVELLRTQGHEVRVWAASLDWTALSFFTRLFFHLRDLISVHPMAKEVIAWEPEVLLSHNLTGVGFGAPQNIKNALKKRKPNSTACWVHVLHDVQLFHPLGLLADEARITLVQRAATLARRTVFGRPDAVVSPTSWLLQAHLRRGWFKGVTTSVLPNPAPERETVSDREWNTPLRVVFVGRVSADKGANVLTQLMQTTTRPIEWRVVGAQSELLKEIALPVGSSLVIQPESSPEIVLQAMREADVLLVPSQIEDNQPTVLLEAFAVGLPVIGSVKGGIPETIGVAGLVVKADEPEAWREALNTLTNEPRSTWVARVQTAWLRHAPERVAGALVEVFKSNKKM